VYFGSGHYSSGCDCKKTESEEDLPEVSSHAISCEQVPTYPLEMHHAPVEGSKVGVTEANAVGRLGDASGTAFARGHSGHLVRIAHQHADEEKQQNVDSKHAKYPQTQQNNTLSKLN